MIKLGRTCGWTRRLLARCEGAGHPRRSQAESLSDIPKTGRIGRFAKILEKEVNEDILKKIMQGSDKYNSLKPDKKAL